MSLIEQPFDHIRYICTFLTYEDKFNLKQSSKKLENITELMKFKKRGCIDIYSTKNDYSKAYIRDISNIFNCERIKDNNFIHKQNSSSVVVLVKARYQIIGKINIGVYDPKSLYNICCFFAIKHNFVRVPGSTSNIRNSGCIYTTAILELNAGDTIELYLYNFNRKSLHIAGCCSFTIITI